MVESILKYNLRIFIFISLNLQNVQGDPIPTPISFIPNDTEPNEGWTCRREESYPFTDPKQCRRYFHCVGRGHTAQTTFCPYNLVFDSLDRKCLPKEIAQCGAVACDKHGDFLADFTNRQFYFICDRGILRRTRCQPWGTIFDHISGICIRPHQLKASSNPTTFSISMTSAIEYFTTSTSMSTPTSTPMSTSTSMSTSTTSTTTDITTRTRSASEEFFQIQSTRPPEIFKFPLISNTYNYPMNLGQNIKIPIKFENTRPRKLHRFRKPQLIVTTDKSNLLLERFEKISNQNKSISNENITVLTTKASLNESESKFVEKFGKNSTLLTTETSVDNSVSKFVEKSGENSHILIISIIIILFVLASSCLSYYFLNKFYLNTPGKSKSKPEPTVIFTAGPNGREINLNPTIRPTSHLSTNSTIRPTSHLSANPTLRPTSHLSTNLISLEDEHVDYNCFTNHKYAKFEGYYANILVPYTYPSSTIDKDDGKPPLPPKEINPFTGKQLHSFRGRGRGSRIEDYLNAHPGYDYPRNYKINNTDISTNTNTNNSEQIEGENIYSSIDDQDDDEPIYFEIDSIIFSNNKGSNGNGNNVENGKPEPEQNLSLTQNFDEKSSYNTSNIIQEDNTTCITSTSSTPIIKKTKFSCGDVHLYANC